MRFPWLVLLAIAVLATPSPGRPQSDAELREYDARLVETLRATDPEAADLFTRANEARLASQEALAGDLYRSVIEKAPSFTPAQRRLGMLLAPTEKHEEGLALCRKALALEESWENLSALSVALATSWPKGTPSANDLREAALFARHAMAAAPREETPARALCGVALETSDMTMLEEGVKRLESVAPAAFFTLYTRAIVEANAGRLESAASALDRARAAGLPEEAYQRFSNAIDEARPWTSRFLGPASWILGVWISGFVLLVAAGWWLSRSTLRTVERMPPTPEGSAQGASIRGVYRTVLAACCAYYYVSLPLVLAIVVVAGGSAVYGMVQLGHIPIKLLVIIVIAVCVTLWSALRSLIVTSRDEDPGQRLDLSKHPRLRGLLDEVAAKIGTSPVTNVYMTPGTEIAVMERGGMAKRVSGRSERCLILGAGVLEGLRLDSFQAILAHEYGHFSSRDTAGGGLALAVRRSIHTMAYRMAVGGAATWYNPAWWFLQGFHRVFLFVSQGASRLQEILADRWAAFAYGSQAFEDGLRHVIEASVRFHWHVEGTIEQVTREKRWLPNLYAHSPTRMPSESALEREIHAALDREASPWDSHPSPTDRFRWVRALRVENALPSASDGAWELFSDREGIEKSMTADIRTILVKRRLIGVHA